jgi:P27 family predicted phage terminase small subunit
VKGDGLPKPPKHLSAEVRAWWRQATETYELEPHHLRLLQLACEAWDAAQQARRALARHGPTFTDRFGQPRVRPEVAVARGAMVTFARLTRELGFDVSNPESRPPRRDGRD